MRVPCPRCGEPLEADEAAPLSPAFPFCSERCRLLDRGMWFAEEYRVEGRAPGGAGGDAAER